MAATKGAALPVAAALLLGLLTALALLFGFGGRLGLGW
jgi:hypothetical protein